MKITTRLGISVEILHIKTTELSVIFKTMCLAGGRLFSFDIKSQDKNKSPYELLTDKNLSEIGKWAEIQTAASIAKKLSEISMENSNSEQYMKFDLTPFYSINTMYVNVWLFSDTDSKLLNSWTASTENEIYSLISELQNLKKS